MTTGYGWSGSRSSSTRARNGSVPVTLETTLKLLRGQFQERLPDKAPSDIEHRSRQVPLAPILARDIVLLDLREGLLHAFLVRYIGTDPHRLPARLVDLRHHGVVIGRVARKQDDGIGGGEFARDGGARAGADSGDDCKWRGRHFGANVGEDGAETGCEEHVVLEFGWRSEG